MIVRPAVCTLLPLVKLASAAMAETIGLQTVEVKQETHAHTLAANAETARRELAPGFEGDVIGPADAGYDDARALYNAMFDKRPAVIARCTSAADVARAVGFARAHGMPLAIRGGAHNGAGLASVDDGIVADLSPLRSVTDPG